jgi:hypothetical protein
MGLFSALKKVAKEAVDAVEEAVEAVEESLEDLGEGVSEAFGGAANELFGSNGNAWDFRGAAGAFTKGMDKALLGSAETLTYGFMGATETATGGIVDGASDVFGKNFGAKLDAGLDRFFDSSRSVLTAPLHVGIGGARNLTEGTGTILDGFGKLFQGDGRGFLKGLGVGLVQLSFQTPADAFLTEWGSYASGVQTMVKAERPGRPLSPKEVRELERVFRTSVPYERIRIKEGGAGIFKGPQSRPFAFVYTIYMKTPGPGSFLPVLVHETVHVWQYVHGGTDYMTEALWGQQYGNGYDWFLSVPHTPWPDLEPEEQAQLIEEAYRAGFFHRDSGSYRRFGWDLDGDGTDEDLSAYVRNAVRDLRAGLGAP